MYCNCMYCNCMYCNCMYCNCMYCNGMHSNCMYCNCMYCNCMYCNCCGAGMRFCALPGYFGGYELTKSFLLEDGQAAPTPMQSLAAGSAAGVFFWVCALPMDVIKTRMQAGAAASSTGASPSLVSRASCPCWAFFHTRRCNTCPGG